MASGYTRALLKSLRNCAIILDSADEAGIIRT